MSRLKIGGRLYLVFALFLVPVVYLLYSVITEKNISIEFARKELVGNTYLTALRDFQLDLHATLRDSAARDRLAKEIAGLAELESHTGAGMDSADMARILGEQSRKLLAAAPGQSGSDTLAALRNLVGRIGDQSNLILDPDLDSFYVMDAVVVKMPDLVDRLAALADFGVAIAGKGALSADDRTDYLLAKGGLDTTLEGLEGSVSSGYRGNADGSLKATLDGRYQSAKKAWTRFESELNAAVIERGGAGVSAAQLYQLEKAALEESAAFWKTGNAELARLLRLRIDGFLTGMWTTLGVTALLFVVVFSFGGFTVVRGVVRPIQAMTEVMSRLAEGDKGVAIPASENRDEIGDMARAVVFFKNTMIEADRLAGMERENQRAREERAQRIEHFIGDFDSAVSAVVQRVSAAATQLQADAQELSATAEQTTRQAKTVAEAAEEASSNVQTVAAATEELSCSVSEISRQVDESSQIAVVAVSEANRTNATVAGLSDAAQKIGEVVNLINEIASQTNLLALNATIEAARAGDAGKGFAVVAGEVKNLATQTAKATEDIQAQVAQMQAVTSTAVGAIQGITGTIRRMSEITAAIAGSVSEQGAATSEISRNVQQASAGTIQVSSNIGDVTTAAGQTGAMASHTLAAAHELADQSGRLRNEVNEFIKKVRAA